MAELEDGGWSVAYCEGGALTLLLYCLCFDRLYSIYRALAIARGSSDPDKGVHFSMYCIRFGREAEKLKSLGQPLVELPSQLVADIENATEATLLRAFDLLSTWQRRPPGFKTAIPAGFWRGQHWIGVDRSIIVALFRALGTARLATIAKEIMIDPESLARAGWPDLICVRGAKVELVEVKTTDRLTDMQIIAMPTIRNAGRRH